MSSSPAPGPGGLDADDAAAIRRIARGSLVAARALEVTPVPIDDLVANVGFQQKKLFDLGENAPPGILAIAKKLTGKVLGAASKREKLIYVDSSVKYERGRFTKAHELGHTALPWHEDAYFADDELRLNQQTRERLEQEANLYAAEVLFGTDRFTEQIDSRRFDPRLIQHYANEHQTSLHAALHRFAETSRRPAALIVLGRHIVYRNGAPSLKVLSSVCSPAFTARYGHISSHLESAYPATDGVFGAAHLLDQGVDEDRYDLSLDTSRGPTPFASYAFAGRVKFVLLHRPRTLPRRSTIFVTERPA